MLIVRHCILLELSDAPSALAFFCQKVAKGDECGIDSKACARHLGLNWDESGRLDDLHVYMRDCRANGWQFDLTYGLVSS